MEKNVDYCRAFSVLMTDLSNPFDCLHHEILLAKLYTNYFDLKSMRFIQHTFQMKLILAKLDTYSFDIKSMKLTQNFPSNGKKRVKIGKVYSS